jgi:thymidylate synthase (FAD)
MTEVLDKGEITLMDYMGSDLAVVQGARISNGAAMPDWRGAPDERLINFLAENGHMSPFEHAVFKFYVKAPLFVVREWQRHRTFSYNERSGRYKKFEAEFYIPLHARVPDPNNKQSSIEDEDLYLDGYQAGGIIAANDFAWKAYEKMLERGIAREVARMVLPLNLYTEFIVTGSFRNWMHFLELRNTPEAQFEIRVYAQEIAKILDEKMPISYKALTRVVS